MTSQAEKSTLPPTKGKKSRQQRHREEDQKTKNQKGTGYNLQSCRGGPCSWLTACVPSKSLGQNPSFQRENIRKWSLWEMISSWGWPLMNEVSTLTREMPLPPESSLAFYLPFESTEKNPQSGTQNHALTGTQSSWQPDLGLPVFRTVRNKYSLFKPPSLQ